MNWDFSQFHFIRPAYLAAIPLLFVLWFLLGRVMNSSHWGNYISKNLLETLKVEGGKSSHSWRWVLLVAWIVSCFAVAGPSWTKIPVPTVQNQKALVIILDLSRSMLARDLSPNRLTLAKFKLIDILRRQVDGQTALIAYAGDAHTVSPLTDDPKNIEALLPALHPNIMPIQGSNVEAAVELAEQLLSDAQVSAGDILIITDGIAVEAQKYLKKNVKSSNRLSILGVAGEEGAPIPVEGGGFLRGANKEIILASLKQKDHQQLANDLRGYYSQIKTDETDLDHILFEDFDMIDSNLQNEDPEFNATYDSWADMGHWFVILLLPLAAFSFRKGLIYILPFVIPAMFLFTPETQAADFTWKNLWQTPDQQAAKLMEQQNYSAAAETFERDDWAGIANYKDGNYESATSHLANDSGIEGIYNHGNALAFKGDMQAAIQAYEKVLTSDPGHEDAAHNKEVLEKLLEQQEQEGEKQNDEQNQESSDSEQKPGEGEEQKSDQENSENKDSESDEGDQQEQQNPSEQEESEQAEEDDEKKEQGEPKPEEGEATDEQQQEQDAQISAEPTPDELKPSSEQWLRAINDDPSGLLRRKFQYQSQQRSNNGQSDNQKQLESQSERY